MLSFLVFFIKDIKHRNFSQVKKNYILSFRTAGKVFNLIFKTLGQFLLFAPQLICLPLYVCLILKHFSSIVFPPQVLYLLDIKSDTGIINYC